VPAWLAPNEWPSKGGGRTRAKQATMKMHSSTRWLFPPPLRGALIPNGQSYHLQHRNQTWRTCGWRTRPEQSPARAFLVECWLAFSQSSPRRAMIMLFYARTRLHSHKHPHTMHIHRPKGQTKRAMPNWWNLPFREFVVKEVTRPGFREFAVGAV